MVADGQPPEVCLSRRASGAALVYCEPVTTAEADFQRALGTLTEVHHMPGGDRLESYAGGASPDALTEAAEAYWREQRLLEREERRRIWPGSYVSEYGWGLALFVPWVALVLVKLILG